MTHFSTCSFISATGVRWLVLFLLALRLPAAAQGPVWQSAQTLSVVSTVTSGGSYSAVSATAVDAAGNVYLAGRFTNTVVLGGTTLTSLGSNDVFVAKFNPASNQFVWAQRAGGTGNDEAVALVVSGTSVYVTGAFNSLAADFGATTLTSAGHFDVFVAKLTDAGSTGRFAWAQRAGGIGGDNARALAVSGSSVYVAGGFSGPTANFGPITLAAYGGSTSLNDVFVAKLTDAGSTGSFAWVQRAGGMGNDLATALVVSGPSVYVAGGCRGSVADFGSTTLTNAGGSDVFVAKLTDAGPTGSFVWAQQGGGTSDEVAVALAVSGTSVYVAGDFYGSASSFGAVILTSSAGGNDVFVAKLTDAGPTGGFVWAQRAGGSGIEQTYALAVSGRSVYVAGGFVSATAGFGAITLTNAGNSGDGFVAKLTDAGPTGSFAWAQRAGGMGHDQATALAVSGTSVYVAGGFYSPTADFGTTTLLNANSSTALCFLATLTDPTLTATAASRAPAPAQLFPNPAHGTATLRLPAGTAPAPLALTDALGRTVRHYPASVGPEAVLDLRGLPLGFYLLRGAGPARRLAVE
jgi:hypothetical protein